MKCEFFVIEKYLLTTLFRLLIICYPVNTFLFKVNNRNTRKRCEICSKLTINTPERGQ